MEPGSYDRRMPRSPTKAELAKQLADTFPQLSERERWLATPHSSLGGLSGRDAIRRNAQGRISVSVELRDVKRRAAESAFEKAAPGTIQARREMVDAAFIEINRRGNIARLLTKLDLAIVRSALDVFGDASAALEWLLDEKFDDGHAPVEIARAEDGKALVLQALGRVGESRTK